jgi:hypothetical protein
MENSRPPKPLQDVQFNHTTGVAFAAVLGGVAIALGVPYIALRFGAAYFNSTEQFWFLVGAVALGGLIALTGVFFGAVMPHSVHEMWEAPSKSSEPPK